MYDMYPWDQPDSAAAAGDRRATVNGSAHPRRIGAHPGRAGRADRVRPRKPFRWLWIAGTTEATRVRPATSKVRRMASSAIKLAVIGGDGIGPEVVAEALKVLRAAAGRGRRDHLRPGRAALAPDRGDAAGLGAGGDPRPRRDPARRGRRPERAQRRAGARACCCGCGSSSTSTSTCARSGSTRGWRPRWPASGPRRSTWWSSARAPRAPTPARAACCARAPRPRWPPRRASTPRSGCDRVVRYAFERASRAAAQAAHPRAQDQRARLRRRPVAAHRGRGWRRSSAGITVDYCHVDAASHVPRHPAGAVRRDRDRQPLR